MKPGYLCTEFWLGAVYTILTLANQSGILADPIPVSSVMTIAAPVITYMLTRSAGKALAVFIGAKPVDPKKLNE